MGEFVADVIIKKLILANKVVKKAKVVILGIAFKEDCPDTRNSKVADIIKRLNEYGIEPIVVDPQADKDDAKHEYSVNLVDLDNVKDADCLVFAVAHDEFKNMSWEQIDELFGKISNNEKVIIDVKSILDNEKAKSLGYSYWSL